jgi:hypothetical protein
VILSFISPVNEILSAPYSNQPKAQAIQINSQLPPTQNSVQSAQPRMHSWLKTAQPTSERYDSRRNQRKNLYASGGTLPRQINNRPSDNRVVQSAIAAPTVPQVQPLSPPVQDGPSLLSILASPQQVLSPFDPSQPRSVDRPQNAQIWQHHLHLYGGHRVSNPVSYSPVFYPSQQAILSPSFTVS